MKGANEKFFDSKSVKRRLEIQKSSKKNKSMLEILETENEQRYLEKEVADKLRIKIKEINEILKECDNLQIDVDINYNNLPSRIYINNIRKIINLVEGEIK